MLIDDARELLRHAAASDRLSHAYIFAGPPNGEAADLAVFLMQLLACKAGAPGGNPCGECDACRQIAARTWPDAYWLQPAKKSRIISVEQMRRGPLDRQNPFSPPYFLPWLAETSFFGGWKFGIVSYADRMNPSAANTFLKTLEEPPPETMLLLLTDSPQQLLPTIRSRCALVELTTPPPELPPKYFEPLVGALAGATCTGPLAAMALSNRIIALLEEMKGDAEEEVRVQVDEEEGVEIDKDQREAMISSIYRGNRSILLLTVLRWVRDLLVLRAGGNGSAIHHVAFAETLAARAAKLTLAQAIANVEAVEELSRQLERSIPETTALPYWLDRINLGVEAR